MKPAGSSFKPEPECVTRAKNILRGQHVAPRELLGLSKQLKDIKKLGLARRILAKAHREVGTDDDKALRLKIIQQHALCTYKDPDLPADAKLDRALEILKETETVTPQGLDMTTDQETLGIAGAIHKRKWEIDGQKQHLERSLDYYKRGCLEGVAGDYGYTAINSAFVLDLLASQEAVAATARSRRQEARRIREKIVEIVPMLPEQPGKEWLKSEWWFLATVAEALFGLGRYEEARQWLKDALALPKRTEWEYESTARQLATLVRFHEGDSGTTAGPERTPAWDVLGEFLGSDADALRSATLGKVGLALSGGGFRASLFHIGVLAKLAEMDVLRSVEVLSCVSGGSIIGAHYYLEVRRLLQNKPDGDITRQDYIDIVRRIEKDFLEGVQRNIRTRVAADWKKNFKMIVLPGYSRTLRAGQLYEEELFSRVSDGEQDSPRWLNKLFVEPMGWPKDKAFSPKSDNWRRSAKVPILVLNATTLNTGHNWQFTASWMGEPPARIVSEIDGNDRLRRMYYWEAPKPHQDVRLGHAVAASACVPGIFEPLALAGLYPDRTVRLVDGGVHDNQGVAGLLEEDCTVLLVSDASGQIGTQNSPGDGLVSVTLRSNSILQARIREAEYHELNARRRASLARGLMFIHLKKDLEVDPVPWLGCEDSQEASDDASPIDGRGPLTSYGIRKDVQRRIAAIRTDLDSFSDKEAFALMMSGYRMTEHQFPRSITGFPPPPDEKPAWRFLEVEPFLNNPERSDDGRPHLNKILDAASGKGFKVWKLLPSLKILSVLLALVAIAGLAWVISRCWASTLLTVGGAASAILGLAAVFIAGPVIVGMVRYRKTLTEIGMGIALTLFGYAAARLHLRHFDRWYLQLGSVARQAKPEVTPDRRI
jgi:predicted acylesterase/phospholipase RssA